MIRNFDSHSSLCGEGISIPPSSNAIFDSAYPDSSEVIWWTDQYQSNLLPWLTTPLPHVPFSYNPNYFESNPSNIPPSPFLTTPSLTIATTAETPATVVSDVVAQPQRNETPVLGADDAREIQHLIRESQSLVRVAKPPRQRVGERKTKCIQPASRRDVMLSEHVSAPSLMFTKPLGVLTFS